MARDPIVEPFNVKLEPKFPQPIANIAPPATSNAGAPTPIRFGFGPQDTAVVLMEGSVQSGLFAASDRKDCDLEFMQFATPVRLRREYVGLLKGSTMLELASHIRGKEFLDAPTDNNNTGTLLVPVHGPFMSRTTHRSGETRDGHFVNSMKDHPGAGTPDFLVAENGERHFLLQVSLLTTFTTVLVFLHPSRRRQPVALIRWVVSYDFTTQWRGGRITTISGQGKMSAGAVTTVPDALVDFVERVKVNSPPTLVINQVVNPNLMKGLTNPLPDANERSFNPVRHPALDGDFWVP